MVFKDKLKYIEELDSELKSKLLEIYNSIFILSIDDDKEIDVKLSADLGELAFLIVQSEMSYENRIQICSRLYTAFERGNEDVAIKIKNFFEIVCTIDEYMLNWLINKQKSKENTEKKNSVFITEIIAASMVKRGEADACEREIEFLPNNYRGYRELSTYYLFSGDYIKSLYYINKAIKSSPENEKNLLQLKRKEIIYRMEK